MGGEGELEGFDYWKGMGGGGEDLVRLAGRGEDEKGGRVDWRSGDDRAREGH